MSLNQLWVEKYRPRKIDDVIFQDDAQHRLFKSMVANKEIPNLLLTGIQGTGKTTISRALIDELGIDPGDILSINASDENGVDTMRDKIRNFVQSMPFGNNFKIVQLEEADYMSKSGQAILRQLMENYSSVSRFILTCNHANMIIPALKSRTQEFNFKAPDLDQIMVLAVGILDAEQIDFDLEVLEKFVSVGYPDIRKIVNLLQQNSTSGKLVIPEKVVKSDGDYKFVLLDLITSNNFRQARKVVCENADKEEYDDIYRFLYENIHKSAKFASQDKEEAAIVLIASYLYKHSLVALPDVNLAALFIELGNI